MREGEVFGELMLIRKLIPSRLIICFPSDLAVGLGEQTISLRLVASSC